jgi:hypothetical protein
VSPRDEALNVAIAAVTCGRLTQADVVHAARGFHTARADQYGVIVTESDCLSPGPPWGARRAGGRGEVVLEYWGGDAEMLAFESTLKRTTRRSNPVERARMAARTIRDYDLDSIAITYPDGAQLSADRFEVVLRGPHRGRLRRRSVLIRVALGELL